MPRQFVIAALLAALGCAGGGTAAAQELAPGQVEIALRANASAPQRLVRLGDVATIRTTDLAAIRRLVDLPLGQAPRAGARVVLERQTVADWIRSRLGIGGERLQWSGSERSALSSPAQQADPADIERTARGALQRWLAARSSRFDVDSVGAPAGLQLPAGRVELAARPFPANQQPATRMVVWVDVAVDGSFVRTVPVSFAVDAYKQAWVAATPVGTGAAIAPQMLERREVELASRGVPLEIDGDGSAPLRSLRPLRAGEALTSHNVAAALPVSRGDWVTLQFSAGAVQMEGRAEALQGGGLGQVVRVRMARGSAPVDARIVANGRVEAMP
ncbi:flagellar basal body P-ring formation chaperone FlgA [Ramlibacter sp.]|uniref:flagellar basal body P-ring formation chaperone FlgA n=1 Tax=Ramlibacter sp. TaxID=1917967 RepID=UPI00182F5210|nr:flagellar basal body P-ring formation chaperone FlgA [Ramlibacter sp.]MBA2673201.1 flagellar basal body P-ring formation protein FlgA [Ramlibacter sp.]